jgi:transposase InsO family protein
MGVPRSSFYAAPETTQRDAAIVAEIRAITDEFAAYGYRRVDAELRHRGRVVNSKKVRRLMKEHDLNPRRRRRWIRTTDSDHDGPIFPFIAKDMEPQARVCGVWKTTWKSDVIPAPYERLGIGVCRRFLRVDRRQATSRIVLGVEMSSFFRTPWASGRILLA